MYGFMNLRLDSAITSRLRLKKICASDSEPRMKGKKNRLHVIWAGHTDREQSNVGQVGGYKFVPH